MKILGPLAAIAGLILAVIVALAVSSGLLVLLAYGVGLVVNLVLRFDPFQAAALSLAGILAVGWLAVRIFTSGTTISPPFFGDEEEEIDDSDDEEEEEEEVDEEEEPGSYPSIPRWRQSPKSVDFSTAQPNDRCPCGSGRKYKNCHGARRLK